MECAGKRAVGASSSQVLSVLVKSMRSVFCFSSLVSSIGVGTFQRCTSSVQVLFLISMR